MSETLLLMMYEGPASRDDGEAVLDQACGIDSNDSIATVPMQREAGRETARDKDLKVSAELILEYKRDGDNSALLDLVCDKVSEGGLDGILVANLDLFNRSGLASRLIPVAKEKAIVLYSL